MRDRQTDRQRRTEKQQQTTSASNRVCTFELSVSLFSLLSFFLSFCFVFLFQLLHETFVKKGDVFSGGPSNLHTINQIIAKTGLGQSVCTVSESLGDVYDGVHH